MSLSNMSRRNSLGIWRWFAMATIAAAVANSHALAVEFRSIDGSGNGQTEALQGAANTRVIRFGYDADYPDGIGDVITETRKPNPRDVSNAVNAQSSSILNNRGLSDWAVHWGQFLTHDMTLIDTGAAYNALSTGATGDFNIPITDPSDPLGPNPIAFNRSKYDPTSGTGELMVTPRGIIPIPRWQINSVTSYIDASNVYGSDQATADSLRTMVDGKLITSGGGLLPKLGGDGRFVAGDVRANENVGLSAIHSLFVREHNRLADRIKLQDGSLSDGEIYQWARKIVGAEMQAITYREFLPALMGAGAPRAEDYFYDEGDASITTAFSTAAFRYGHSMQSSRILLVDNAGAQVGAVGLAAATENPAYLTSDPAKVDLILKGLSSQTAQENDAYIVDGLRNINFGPPGSGGTDLAALDIQRGRDHGLLNSYRLMRQAYNLAPLGSFDQLTSDPLLQIALANTYGTTDNLDAWVAMIAENHVAGSSLGSLAQVILHSQFERLRDGDRFFFTGDPDLETELVRGVIDLDSISLSQIIKLNSGITQIQSNVFFAVPEPATIWLILCGTSWIAYRVRHQRQGY
jgi:peroxidase